MEKDASLLPGRLLRRAGPAKPVKPFQGVQIDDPRLAEVLSLGAELLCLYEGTLHGEGPVWQPARDCLLWSDVPNRRLLGWHLDGHVGVVIDGTYFMNGNALEGSGALVHCEHGRRCISRSGEDGDPTPIITHFEGKRLNSPNDVRCGGRGDLVRSYVRHPDAQPGQPGGTGAGPPQRLPVRADHWRAAPDGGFRGAQRTGARP